MQPGEALTERETLELIFAPGLSTRDAVTETSGRGVGMDVVRSNLAALGGVVDVESTPGRGTTHHDDRADHAGDHPVADRRRRRAPLRDPALVGAGDALMLPRGAIQRSEGRELLDLRGEPLLLRHLAREFDLRGRAGAARVSS